MVLWLFVVVSLLQFTTVYSQDCDDREPANAAFNCQSYLSLGLCSSLQEQDCKKSCGKCDIEDIQGEDCSVADNLQCDIDALLAFKNSLTAGMMSLKEFDAMK
eukprot:TRINITY_DN2115_c2_g1_i3.p2 TRINITY_DN2115_c2_g1~~TRINITY_DN2115_c2_g1_i3.p2  ORF type:complete len:103 (+),score=11.45 TRINITY_DN2115_c2_g1_i3:275-583(+)